MLDSEQGQERLALLLDLVSEHVPAQVERVWAKDIQTAGRCLNATRVGLEVLTYFGVQVEPMPTRALAVNDGWMRWVHGTPGGPKTPMPDEAWSVAVGWPTGGPGLDAHLVLVVEDDILLDLDAGQFARPAHGIHVPAVAMAPIEDLTKDGVTLRCASFKLDDGAVLDYGEHPEPPPWRQAPGWRKSARHAGPVIRTIRDCLAD